MFWVLNLSGVGRAVSSTLYWRSLSKDQYKLFGSTSDEAELSFSVASTQVRVHERVAKRLKAFLIDQQPDAPDVAVGQALPGPQGAPLASQCLQRFLIKTRRRKVYCQHCGQTCFSSLLAVTIEYLSLQGTSASTPNGMFVYFLLDLFFFI